MIKKERMQTRAPVKHDDKHYSKMLFFVADTSIHNYVIPIHTSFPPSLNIERCRRRRDSLESPTPPSRIDTRAIRGNFGARPCEPKKPNVPSKVSRERKPFSVSSLLCRRFPLSISINDIGQARV